MVGHFCRLMFALACVSGASDNEHVHSFLDPCACCVKAPKCVVVLGVVGAGVQLVIRFRNMSALASLDIQPPPFLLISIHFSLSPPSTLCNMLL
jgi:hypothetical protein